jgi:hypothetical protein
MIITLLYIYRSKEQLSLLADTIYSAPTRVSTATEKAIKKAKYAFEKDNMMDLGPSIPANYTPRPWGTCEVSDEKSDSKSSSQNYGFGLLNNKNEEDKEFGFLNTETDAFSSIGSVAGVNRNPLIKSHRKKN